MPTAAVVGAGVTGSALAGELARRGFDVTLLEQHRPGTVRSASGGDTRLTRAGHGPEEWYARSALRSLELWRRLEAETGVRLFEEVGLAWLARSADGFEARCRPVLELLGVEHEWLTPDDASDLFPMLDPTGLEAVLWEPGAGVLYARAATRLLAAEAVRLGVLFDTVRAAPGDAPGADVVVWACGAWLPALFPGLVEVEVSRRDVFFFGGGAAWNGAPGFVEYDAGFYGHGDVGGLGVKVCPDFSAPLVEPDTLERLPNPALLDDARRYAAARFPGLADAPVIGARVCQYDLTADTHFLVDRHPERPGWWLVGGGSGHGFKHGPALAEYIADCIEGRYEPESFHALGERSGDAGLRTGAS
jgi:glycine/D-amino acid oxidase-like deaminating enzyme